MYYSTLLPLAVLLVNAWPVHAQSTQWDELLKRGNAADEQGDKIAESLLKQSCDLSVKEPGSTPQRTACMRLAQFYSLRDNFPAAQKVLEQLLERLQALTAPQSADVVETLLELADVQSARARFDSVTGTLRQTFPLLAKLPPPQRCRSLVRISQFYLAQGANGRSFATTLLENAWETLAAAKQLDDVAFVAAVSDLAYVQRQYGFTKESFATLGPIVPQVRSYLEEKDSLTVELQSAYLDLVEEYANGLTLRDGEAAGQELRDQVKEQRLKLIVPGSELMRVGGLVLAPRPLRRPAPSYTPGASAADAEGTVVVSVEIWEDGRAHNIQAYRRFPFGLTWSAIRTLRQWRFEPGTKEGRPVKVFATIEVNFRRMRR